MSVLKSVPATPNKKPNKKKSTRKVHSKETKAVAIAMLEANGGNISQTARDMDIPERSINSWANGQKGGSDPEVLALVPEARELIKEGLWTTAWEANQRIRELIKTSQDLKAVTIALGIVIDKATLISGDAKTQILNSFDFQTNVDAERERRRLQAIK